MLLRAFLLSALVLLPRIGQAATTMPTVAVYGFNSAGVTPTGGVTPWWGNNFDPGAALSDLLTDRLTNLGTLSVVDRNHLEAVLKEQHISAGGDVTPATEAQLGRMLGVGYLFIGKIEQFNRSTPEGMGQLNNIFSRVAGTTSSTKTILTVSMQIINANTGQVVESVEDTQRGEAKAYTLNAAPGNYGNSDFEGSAMGKLIDTVADDLAKKVDPVKLTAKPVEALVGHVLEIDGESIVLNIGSDKGATVGMTFSVEKVRQVLDPDSKEMITTEIPLGTVQVVSVSKESSVAKKITGSAKVSDVVRSQ